MLFILMVIRGDSQQVDVFLFRTLNKDFFVEIKAIDGDKLVEFAHVIEMCFVGVRVAEGEIDPFLFTFK